MTRPEHLSAIARHLSAALYLADGLPTTPGQMFLRDAIAKAVREAQDFYPASEAQDAKGRQ